MERPMTPQRSVVEMLTPTKFLATGYTGAQVQFHVPAEGEVREGPSPFESVVLAAGGCTAFDVVGILTKEPEPVQSFPIELEAERAKKPPRGLKKLHITEML